MKTALFGGTFDPPHNGHLALCLYARELAGIERLIVSVSKNPFKGPSDASDDDRKAMAGLLTGEINAAGRFAETSGWELRQSGPSYTIDLLRHVEQRYPDDELTLLVGEDSYRQMPQWKSAPEIPKHCTIAVFGRSGGESVGTSADTPSFPAQHYDFDMPVSATEIRRLVAADHSITHLVPPSIAAYIASRGLYRA
ncbi:MAG: nicotinate (nicotinamide) nucleotide adenylyltransferase [Chlorobaculum sp.]|nr:nicotinate (nicotinamide) nucleotide adenylyltransferase [Chlorobaculum sp.]